MRTIGPVPQSEELNVTDSRSWEPLQASFFQDQLEEGKHAVEDRLLDLGRRSIFRVTEVLVGHGCEGRLSKPLILHHLAQDAGGAGFVGAESFELLREIVGEFDDTLALGLV